MPSMTSHDSIQRRWLHVCATLLVTAASAYGLCACDPGDDDDDDCASACERENELCGFPAGARDCTEACTGDTTWSAARIECVSSVETCALMTTRGCYTK